MILVNHCFEGKKEFMECPRKYPCILGEITISPPQFKKTIQRHVGPQLFHPHLGRQADK
jgi:hypothetical protein